MTVSLPVSTSHQQWYDHGRTGSRNWVRPNAATWVFIKEGFRRWSLKFAVRGKRRQSSKRQRCRVLFGSKMILGVNCHDWQHRVWNTLWLWWCSGRIGALELESFSFETTSIRIVGTLSKSFSCNYSRGSAWNSDAVSLLYYIWRASE